MEKKKVKIGNLIQISDERNKEGIKDFYGININKEFIPTVADTSSVDAKKYKVLRNKRFVFSGMQTGRDEAIRIAMYTGESPIVVSPAYTTFEVKDSNVVLPEYLHMIFMSKEKDRLGAFMSDGSIRANLDWDVFCDIEIELPPIEVQQKYVTIYNSIKQMRNRLAIEKELLEKVCSIEIEKLLKTKETISLSKLVELNTLSNDALTYGINDVYGVSQDKTIIPTKAKPKEEDLKSFTVITKNDFIYNPRNGVAVALNRNFEGIISFNNTSFRVNKEYSDKYLPEYIFMFLKRPEWDRKVKFLSWGSSTEVFSFDALGETEIPVTSYETQYSLSRIHNEAENKRERVLALDTLLKKLCPVLIKASIS